MPNVEYARIENGGRVSPGTSSIYSLLRGLYLICTVVKMTAVAKKHESTGRGTTRDLPSSLFAVRSRRNVI